MFVVVSLVNERVFRVGKRRVMPISLMRHDYHRKTPYNENLKIDTIEIRWNPALRKWIRIIRIFKIID